LNMIFVNYISFADTSDILKSRFLPQNLDLDSIFLISYILPLNLLLKSSIASL